jgi:hypothetical protein
VICRVENLIKIFSELPYNHEKEIRLCAVDFIGCHNDLGVRRDGEKVLTPLKTRTAHP